MIDESVNCDDVYTTSRYSTTMNLKEYFEKYVDIPKIGKYCSLCRNYGKSWECPPHTINVEDYWNQFDKIKILAVKLDYSEEFRSISYSHNQLDYIIKNTLYSERRLLKEELIRLEKTLNGQYLYGGRCDICGKCAKRINETCRHPELMRYSVESIGSNIQKLTPDIFGFSLKWVEKDMKIPEYLVNVCAVLY